MTPPPRALDETPLRLGAEWAQRGGVLHVTSLYTGGHAGNGCGAAEVDREACACPTFTLRVAPGSPSGELDRFALSLARARADAILTTGRILREEARLTHELFGEHAPALARFREETVARSAAPVSLVLTSGAALDWGHPLFDGDAPVGVIAPREAAAELRRAAPARVEVHGVPDLEPRSALAFSRETLGFETIAVECGPSTTRALYRAPSLVDELLLARFDAEELPTRFQAGEFLSRAAIAKLFGDPVDRAGPEAWKGGEGCWYLERYRAGHQRSTKGATSQSVAATGIGAGTAGA